MASHDTLPAGPDLAAGVPLDRLGEGTVLFGHVDGQAVLLTRSDDGELRAFGSSCTHYGAPLADGLVVDGEIRCPWHHACFSLRTGAALRAPAFAPLPAWTVEVVGGMAHVRAPSAPATRPRPPSRGSVDRIIVLGGGAAGFAAAERLRTLGHAGPLTMLSADPSAPYDRPNLSKDYLAGSAPEAWMPLKDADFYADAGIELRLGSKVAAIDPAGRAIVTGGGERLPFDRLLIATGAEPRSLPLLHGPGVFTLRSMADARAIIAAAGSATSAVVVGAGFIGLEVAAALRARGLAVQIVGSSALPMARLFGDEVGRLIRATHEASGVGFVIGVAQRFDGARVQLEDGRTLAADLVVVGVGVAPRTRLAAAAALAVDDGILVDAQLRTSVDGIYAAGDVASYRHGAERIRVEHWVHAQRQGQLAAANMLGECMPFTDVPYFWTHQHGLELRCTGVLRGWDAMVVDGRVCDGDFTIRYARGGRLVGALTAGREADSLLIERELQQQSQDCHGGCVVA